LDMLVKHIVAIETPEGTEDNPHNIKDFINSTEKNVFESVQQHLEKIKDKWTAPPKKFKVPDEYVEKGAHEYINVPMVFDNSNFFAQK
jgi:hypothetical protein